MNDIQQHDMYSFGQRFDCYQFRYDLALIYIMILLTYAKRNL